jgi:hypothetical protein
MRESRTYGSGRGACNETHVPTATRSNQAPHVHHAARRRGGLVAVRGGRAAGDYASGWAPQQHVGHFGGNIVHVILTYPAKNGTLGGRVVESMNPVTRALQTIAAIQSETRELMQAEAASRTEPLRPQNLSASSLAPSNGRDKPTVPSATGKGTANLNRGSGAPSIAQVKVTRSQAGFARGREIRIDKRDRVVVAHARDVSLHGVTIIIGALLLALALCLGWIGGLNLDSFFIKPASLSVEKVTSSADLPDASAKSERLTLQGSLTNTNATATNRAHENSKRGDPTKASTKPAPVPETKPTTIEGWTLLEVKGGTAVLEGPNGVWRATRGDTVPGVGKIDSIVRWGSRWIVATSRGLISTR